MHPLIPTGFPFIDFNNHKDQSVADEIKASLDNFVPEEYPESVAVVAPVTVTKEDVLVSKVDICKPRSGNCYVCSKTSDLVGNMKNHGGVICYDCGIRYLT